MGHIGDIQAVGCEGLDMGAILGSRVRAWLLTEGQCGRRGDEYVHSKREEHPHCALSV